MQGDGNLEQTTQILENLESGSDISSSDWTTTESDGTDTELEDTDTHCKYAKIMLFTYCIMIFILFCLHVMLCVSDDAEIGKSKFGQGK